MLISKYIDGELSHEEDATLRRILKDDNFSREKFDSSVELHLEMAEDAASIEVPKYLYSKTEDMLMMKILSTAPNIKTLTPERSKRSLYGYSIAASLLIAFFLSAALRLGDGSLPQLHLALNQNTDKGELADNHVVANSENALEAGYKKANNIHHIKKSNSNKTVNTPLEFSQIDDINLTGSNLASVYKPNDNISNIVKNLTDDNKSDRVIAVNQSKSAVNLLDQLNTNVGKGDVFQQNNLFGNGKIGDINLDEILLTTIISQSFSTSGFQTSNGKPVMNYSQSIAYSINPDNQVGVEFGFMEFTSQYSYYITIPGRSRGGSGTEVLEPSLEDGTFVTTKITSEGNNRMFWGSAFYERSFLRDASGFYLDGRLGIGSINEGLLSYLRFTAKYELFNGVMLTAGSESRFMLMDIPGYSRGMKSLFGMVYGVQFKF